MQPGNAVIFYWPGAVLIYGLGHLFAIPETLGTLAISDSGLSSWLTIALVVAAFIVVVRCARTDRRPWVRYTLYATAYVILVYGLREADFHRLFTEEHVTRLKYYYHPDISITEKLVAGIPMLILLGCFFYLVIRYARTVVCGLIEQKTWAIALALWATTIFISQLIDKSDLNFTYTGNVIEEMMELCAAGFMLISAWLGTAAIRKTES
jgi:hypothetical protein